MSSIIFASSAVQMGRARLLNASSSYGPLVFFAALIGGISFGVGKYITHALVPQVVNTEEVAFVKTTDNLLEAQKEEKQVEGPYEIFVKRGDTIGKLLTQSECSKEEIASVLGAIKNSLRRNIILKPGYKVILDFDAIEDEKSDELIQPLKTVTIQIDKANKIVINKVGEKFTLKEFAVPLVKKLTKHEVAINGSFAKALKSIGVSAGNTREIIAAYSHSIDFQRQLHNGDKLHVVMERYYTEEGDYVHSGRVLFANLKLIDNEQKIYWFKNSSGSEQYFTESGKTAKRNLLRTPINVAKISSHFGTRKDPFSSYTKMHRGVDFRAPYGTPFLAAGDGVVTEIGWRGGYGKCIQIRHNSSLSTFYAHASKFADNVKVGSKIKQGQVIAYVGTTGRASGAHLHYEVKINGQQVNPLKIHTIASNELTGADSKKFSALKAQMSNFIKVHEKSKKLASN